LIGGKGRVAVISVAKGVSTTDARVAGFEQEMKAKYPGVTLLPEQNDDADSVTTAASCPSSTWGAALRAPGSGCRPPETDAERVKRFLEAAGRV
jgi:hypothetical protein